MVETIALDRILNQDPGDDILDSTAIHWKWMSIQYSGIYYFG